MNAAQIAPERTTDPDSLEQAASRAAEAGQHLMSDQLDLARLELREALLYSAARAVQGGVAAGLALMGWGLVVASAILTLQLYGLPLPEVLLGAGALHLLAGLAVVVWPRRERTP